jgi:16S rRNA processing protein RimM
MYLIGYVLKPQGLKGEIKVNPVSPDLERFKLLEKVYLKNDTIQTYLVENVRISNRFVYLKFSEVNTRDEAEQLRDCEILVDPDERIRLSAGEYFIHDLLDCQVFTQQGDLLGTLVEVWQNSSNDVYVVKNQLGVEILVPAIKDVIKNVDIKAKKIIIQLIEGMV